MPLPGQTVEGFEFQTAAGGKGANQAVAAARLGARVAFVGRVGADARGEEMVAALKRERVDCRYVVRDRRHATGAALIMVSKDGEKSILTAPGANRHLALADVREAARAISSTRVLLVQFEAPRAVVLAAARLAHDVAHRVGDGDALDPEVLGRAAAAITADPAAWHPDRDSVAALQQLKFVWHHLAAFGYRG